MEPVKLHMEPHTKAKHLILERYLEGWFPIMSRWNGKIIYLDGFSGSGIYDSGDPGSPIIALKVAKEHLLQDVLQRGDRLFFFIEKDENSYQTLVSVIQKEFGNMDSAHHIESLPDNFSVFPVNGDFNVEMKGLLDELESKGRNLAPTFAFVDPFGYSIDLSLLSRIVSFPKCEVFFTFMVGFLNRFIFADEHLKPIINTFGISEERIRLIREIQSEELREVELGKLLVEIMKSKIPSSAGLYWLSFRILDKHNRPMYWLVYFTKSTKGMQVMKDSMFEIGGRGSYKFSDFYFDPLQASVLDYSEGEEYWILEAAEYIYKRQKGNTIDIDELKNFVLLDTPYIYRAKILDKIEKDGRLSGVFPPKRRRGTYPPGSLLTFV